MRNALLVLLWMILGALTIAGGIVLACALTKWWGV